VFEVFADEFGDVWVGAFEGAVVVVGDECGDHLAFEFAAASAAGLCGFVVAFVGVVVAAELFVKVRVGASFFFAEHEDAARFVKVGECAGDLSVVEQESVGEFCPCEAEGFVSEDREDVEGAVGGGSVGGFAFGAFDRRGSRNVSGGFVGVGEEAAEGFVVAA